MDAPYAQSANHERVERLMTGSADATSRRAISLVVLGAGKPYSGVAPSALRLLDRQRKVLDWILHAFSHVTTDIFFVGGYEFEDIAESYPGIKFIVNSNWQETGANGSLFLTPLDPKADVYVCYSDIIFRPDLVDRLERISPNAVAVAVDDDALSSRKSLVSRIRTNHETVSLSVGSVPGTEREVEFIGLARFPASVLNDLAQRDARGDLDLSRKHLSALVAEFAKSDIVVRHVSATGLWSDLENDRDLTRFVLGTKAETLERLEGRLKNACVPPQCRFSVLRWRHEPDSVIEEIRATLGEGLFAVRSSALTEDGFIASNAGKFCSVLGVECSQTALNQAVAEVIASYGDQRTDHQIFVQPMVQHVQSSGVLLTRTLQTGGPYQTVAWSDSEDTDVVTGGKSEIKNSIVISRAAHICPSAPLWLKPLLHVAQDVEFMVDSDALDIEFAIDRSQVIHILQVRPLVLDHMRTEQTDGLVFQRLKDAAARYTALMPAASGQVGKLPIWGMMPDWNPAEIIGARPGSLAFDLYDYLICSEVWATQRAEYGYRDVRPYSLLRLFAGYAYVDVRASFNSFVPADLDEATATTLVNAYLDKLRQQPELHDKIEFEIAMTCWSFDFKQKLSSYSSEYSLSQSTQDNIERSLVDITRCGIARTAADLHRADAFGRMLDDRGMDGCRSIDEALALLDRCRRDGTLPFAHLARSAFIAMTLLKSAVREDLISQKRLDLFLRSIRTVSHQFMEDAFAVRSGRQSLDDLIARYGHLRPGTYNILSPSYREAPEKFLKPVVERAASIHCEEFVWADDEIDALTGRLTEVGIPIDAKDLNEFLRNAIEGREYSKFVFTRALSTVMDAFREWGQGIGLSRQDLSDMALADIFAISRGSLACSLDVITPRVEARRHAKRIESLIELPTLLMSERDLFSFRQFATEPNFVTDRTAAGPPRDLNGKFHDPDLEGSIVFIPNADPGYDWIFGHAIAGLVTIYGGVNSHMAIRAAEFGLPAAIGIGELKFRNLRNARIVELNCRERRIQAMEIL